MKDFLGNTLNVCDIVKLTDALYQMYLEKVNRENLFVVITTGYNHGNTV